MASGAYRKQNDMGRRTKGKFAKIPRSLYRTFDPRAVAPLLPHLMPRTKFYEPCAGHGDLVTQLYDAGHDCTGQADIVPHGDLMMKRNALALTEAKLPEETTHIITNPPWDRPILHQLIPLFSDLRPTWLLFDVDWAFTSQSAEFASRLRLVVAVGRVCWMPDTYPQVGYDSVAWYLFDKPSHRVPRFIPMRAPDA